MQRGSKGAGGLRNVALAGAATLAMLATATAAMGQTVTASLRGTIAAATPGSTISARNVADNQTASARIEASGAYVLTGLRPGTYELSFPGADGATHRQTVTVAVGQALSLDLSAAAPADAASVSEVVVTASRAAVVETKTSEVATNVSQVQIRNLPQTDRNFLSFAALAPGVRYNDTEFNRGFTSGAGNPQDVNVFIDGLSLKNDVLAGGIAGQQDSRGNPFPQLAVDQFRG